MLTRQVESSITNESGTRPRGSKTSTSAAGPLPLVAFCSTAAVWPSSGRPTAAPTTPTADDCRNCRRSLMFATVRFVGERFVWERLVWARLVWARLVWARLVVDQDPHRRRVQIIELSTANRSNARPKCRGAQSDCDR